MLLALASLAAIPFLTVQQSFLNGAASVPLGAQRVVMLSVTLTASCGSDLPVQSLTFSHAGLGSPADIARVYALEGERRISRSAVPDSRNGEVTIRLRSFVVPSCGTRTISVAVDMKPDAAAGGEHRLTLRHSTDVAVASAQAAVRLETQAAPALTLRTVGPSRGSLSAAFLPNLLPVNYGADRTLARFRLTADGEDDQQVAAMTLVNEGKARDGDLQHLFLADSDRRPLTPFLAALDGDRVRFVFDPPLIIGRNDQRVLVLHGDVRASRRRTIEFALQEESDIESDVVQRRTPFAP